MSDPWKREGVALVFSSPSGGGKTSIARRLLAREPALALSVSATTRPPRSTEEEGRDYIFLSAEEFEKRERAGGFLESATVFGHRYGTPRAPVERALAEGRDILFDIDWQGASQLRGSLGHFVVSVFILPPSYAALAARLHARAQNNEDDMRARLSGALEEMTHWGEYDYLIVNDALDKAVQSAQAILFTERLRRTRQIGARDFIARLRFS